MTLILRGLLAGMTTPAAIAEWVRHRADQLKQMLPWKRASFPCASTYSNVLRTLDASQLTQVLAQFLTQAEAIHRCGAEPSRLVADAQGQAHEHLALDGKTLRGTVPASGRRPEEDASTRALRGPDWRASQRAGNWGETK